MRKTTFQTLFILFALASIPACEDPPPTPLASSQKETRENRKNTPEPSEKAKADAKESAKIRKVAFELQKIEKSQAKLQTRLSNVIKQTRVDRDLLDESLQALQGDLDELAAATKLLQNTLPATGSGRSLAPGPEQTVEQTGGWPLPVKALLSIVIVVIFILIYMRVAQDQTGGESRGQNDDTAFVEENELGTIHYPGRPGSGHPDEKS